MEAKNIIKSIMQKKDVTQIDIMQKLELKSQSSVSSMLSRDMKASTMVKFLEFLDCELVIRDKNTGEEYTVND